ncbi:MAG: TetR family transcriptional regulator C-terminal domain-containing protein [Gemmatimonadales bacterium]
MAKRPAKRRRREPDVTREKLLHAAFEEIYRRGFQAASLETILAKAGVTKGALYHHFPSKAALGYAVVDEVVKAPLLEAWVGRLEGCTGDSLTALQQVLRQRAGDFVAGGIELGCPLNNLAQEMSPLDERFRRRVSVLLDTWTEAFATVLRRGQAEGTVRRDADARQVAAFVVAAIEGSFGLAKNAKSLAVLHSNLEILARFLESLRPAPEGQPS